jgi:Cadherin domain
VKAYDADTPPFNNQVRYFLKEGDADLFRINASTGEISLLRALDREQQAEYTLTLVAMDTGECQSIILSREVPTIEMMKRARLSPSAEP